MSELPEGWVATTLGEVGRWSSGGTPSKRKPEYYGGDIPWVRTGDLRDEEIYDVEGRISPEGLANSSAKEFPAGTLLVAMYGATIGRTGMLRIPATTNQACAALLPDPVTEDMMPFLWWFFRHKVEDFRAVGQGGAQPNISQTVIKASAIDLPPLPEQRRIVAKLDRLSARSTAARDHLARTAKLATRAKQAILLELLSGDWQAAPLADLAKVSTGATPKKGTSRFYDGGNIPWVTSGAVNDFRILAAEHFITKAAIAETNCKMYPAGTLLMAMYGEGRTRGMVARLEIDAATNQALAAIQISPSAPVRDDWVIWVLHSKYLELRELASGGVQPNLNLGMVRSIEVPIPPLDEQDSRLRKIKTAFARIDRLTEEASRAAHLLNRLDERLLAKAFRGELVPQDPEDEPAEALLARIREARAAAPKAKRGRRKKAAVE